MDIYLGQTEGGVGGADLPAYWGTHLDWVAGLDALFKRASESTHRGWRRKAPVRVWLSGALARPFLCGPVAGLRRWDEVMLFAQAAAPDATGISPACVVQVEGWPDPSPALAVAVGNQTIEAVEAAALQHGVVVRSLRPWWAAALNEAIASQESARLIAIDDGDAMTLIGGDGTGFQTATSHVPKPSSEQGGKLLARMALTADVPLGEVVQIRLARASAAGSINVPFGALKGAAA